MIIISDNSPLSALVAINKLELLQKIYGKVIIPEAVKKELELLGELGKTILTCEWIEVIKTNPRTDILPTGILDIGETEAIWLAKELNADWLIIDELKGRKIARSLGLPIVGVLGILIRAKQEGYLDSLKNVIEELQAKSNFRIHPNLVAEALSLVGE
jgi:uncharacterized protein